MARNKSKAKPSRPDKSKGSMAEEGSGSACGVSSSGLGGMTSKKECTSCEQKLETNDKVDEVGIITGISDISLSICANCSKEGANNTCNKCKKVKYCNAACKKRHRHKHKKDCEEYLSHIAKLREEDIKCAAELHDKELFKQPPTVEDDCPICLLRLPFLSTGSRYQTCCGKMICCGCIYAGRMTGASKLCPFCRIPDPKTDELIIERLQKRIDAADADAVNTLAFFYTNGYFGLPQDHAKAFELRHRALNLGCFEACCNIAQAYKFGDGAEIDEKKANYYFELGAMKGYVNARLFLGLEEMVADNVDRALKHFMLAAKGGQNFALEQIKSLYLNGDATKDDYTKSLQAYQTYLDEIRSPQRDEAAAAREDYKYIMDHSLTPPVLRATVESAINNTTPPSC